MKKRIISLLIVFVMLITLTSCNESVKQWDGSIADEFGSGDGTESSPYEINDPSQLALLAKQVNEGNVYSGKYFSLLCDIDLCDIEWTPIGNGTYGFEGIFDGNGHTVKNLKISVGAFYDRSYTEQITVKGYVSGLFGACTDAVIQNLNISGAEIQVGGFTRIFDISAGVLCGLCNSVNTQTVISNIKISDAVISADFNQKDVQASIMKLGGAVGNAHSIEQSNSIFKQIQADVEISIVNGMASDNTLGGLFGYIHTMSSCSIENCCSYLSAKLDEKRITVKKTSLGAFGTIQSSDKPFEITNIFSKVTADKIYDISHGYPAYTATAYAIIGDAYAFWPDENPSAVGYVIENVFGYLEQTDKESGERRILTDLYKLPDVKDFSQINCSGCESLPENNGFDPDIWDLTDLSNPKLK